MATLSIQQAVAQIRRIARDLEQRDITGDAPIATLRLAARECQDLATQCERLATTLARAYGEAPPTMPDDWGS